MHHFISNSRMPTGEPTTAPRQQRPFQFTLRHILITMVGCSIWLAAIVQFEVLGFLVCYVATCITVIVWGAYRQQDALVVGVTAMLGIGLCSGLPILGGRGRAFSARKASCTNNLHNIALALQQYHDN